MLASAFTLSVLFLRTVSASCPLLGTSFPVPRNLSGSSIIQSAIANLTATIHEAGSTGNSSHGIFNTNATSFSIQIFDTKSAEPLLDYHNSAPLLAAASDSGVKTVDADTVYRIGSISKLLTVFTFLLEAGDSLWNDPVTDYVPELKAAAQQSTNNVNSVRWNEVTLGALASQMAGIPRDYWFGDLLTTGVDLTPYGLPALNASEALVCGITSPCSREDFFKGLLTRSAVFPSFTTPIYSNIAYQILSYALEAITNKNFSSMLQDDVFKPLEMTSSSYTLPANQSGALIPLNANDSAWDFDLGDEAPAGGIYSTPSDLTKFGRAILNSSFLPPAQTRRWMKPLAHTSLFSLSVGAPWEIRRLVHPAENRIIDVYTKSGDIGAYSGIIALIPEYAVGFDILAGGSYAHQDVDVLAGIIGDVFIPQLENAAREEASGRFGGTYNLEETNSTVVLTVQDNNPGFFVETWTNNGQDIIVLLDTIRDVRLYPTDVFSDTSYAFRAVPELPVVDNGPFSWDCASWANVDVYRYGAIGLDEFVFQLGEDGNAVSVQPRAMRTTLPRLSERAGQCQAGLPLCFRNFIQESTS